LFLHNLGNKNGLYRESEEPGFDSISSTSLQTLLTINALEGPDIEGAVD